MSTVLLIGAGACNGEAEKPNIIKAVNVEYIGKRVAYKFVVLHNSNKITTEGPFFDKRKCDVGAEWPKCYERGIEK